MDYRDNIEKVLITAEELAQMVDNLAAQISRDYADKDLLLVCILKGSMIFTGELMQRLTIPSQVDFMKVSSYGSGTTAGVLKVHLDLKRDDLDSKDILIIEDCIDTGRTLGGLSRYLKGKGCRSVKTCALLDKPSRREITFAPDYVGKEIPNEFVVGYGLDYDEDYRSLPYIAVLKPECYN
ncbi:MAG: hypoxanthine phosphoribosyltransferase [Clostridia bacterium]|nr:hypoxanthine phosphoribosyltransferase [Clostridia bacterium]